MHIPLALLRRTTGRLPASAARGGKMLQQQKLRCVGPWVQPEGVVASVDTARPPSVVSSLKLSRSRSSGLGRGSLARCLSRWHPLRQADILIYYVRSGIVA